MLLHVVQGKAGFVQKSSTFGKAVFTDNIGCKAVKGVAQWHDLPTFAIVLNLLTQFFHRGSNNRLQSINFLF